MTDEDLASRRCIPCEGGVPALNAEQAEGLLRQLSAGWQIIDLHHLRREFVFPDFAQALDFTNRVGAIAENNGHHPDIFLTWGKVVIELYTHAINGLSESDFVLAAKIDQA